MAYNEEKPLKMKNLADAMTKVEEKIPKAVSGLQNDKKFQTESEVAAAIQAAIAATGHARFQKVDAVPAADEAVENVLYLVMNSATGHYDIYALVGGSVERLDDTTVDMGGYVEKVEGKGLSTEDYTTEDKEKVRGLNYATDEEVAEMLTGIFGS